MNCKKNQDIISCFRNARNVVQTVKKKGYANYKDYVKMPIVLANASKKFAALLGEFSLKKYRIAQQEGLDESQKKQDKSVEEDVVINYDKFISAYNKQKAKFDELFNKYKYEIGKNSYKLSSNDKNFITNFLLLATPILLEPKRDNFGDLKIIEKPNQATDKNQNYYVRKNRLIILNQYKTFNKYGKQKLLLKSRNSYNKKGGRDLGTIIEQSLKLWDRKYVIGKINGDKFKGGKAGSRLSTALEKFKLRAQNPRKNKKNQPKPLGYNDFRHSRVVKSRQDKDTAEKKRQLAQKMLHSPAMSEKYMRVLGDKVLENV